MKQDGSLQFLYTTAPGRIILKALTSRGVSKLCGRFLDSKMSTCLIKGFVKKNGINTAEYISQDYSSFNEFFYRRIKPDLRPISLEGADFVSPCDGLLSAYRITRGLVLPIKQSRYGIADLIKDDETAARYKDGICLVFRLCVDNYHRYHYVDDGRILKNGFIPGVLHTVRPIALEQLPVFIQNCREYTIMETENCGLVTQVEVGAMLVGRIVNYKHSGGFVRGEEKGRFEYGGSTIVLLLEKGRVSLPEQLFVNTARGIETKVKMGQTLGKTGAKR